MHRNGTEDLNPSFGVENGPKIKTQPLAFDVGKKHGKGDPEFEANPGRKQSLIAFFSPT